MFRIKFLAVIVIAIFSSSLTWAGELSNGSELNRKDCGKALCEAWMASGEKIVRNGKVYALINPRPVLKARNSFQQFDGTTVRTSGRSKETSDKDRQIKINALLDEILSKYDEPSIKD